MSTENESTEAPKSMRHKQILDVAADNPDASMDELASMVPSATTDLVERVFDKYGDPAASDADDATEQPTTGSDSSASGEGEQPTTAADSTEAVDETMDDSQEAGTDNRPADEPSPDEERGSAETTDAADASDSARATTTHEPEQTAEDDDHAVASHDDSAEHSASDIPTKDALTEKQLEVLRYVAAHPDATQRDIGEALDVSSATINNRVNSIDGFEWSDRQAFVGSLFEYRGSTASSDGEESTPKERTLQSNVEELATRLDTLEQRVEKNCGGADGIESAFDDPELVHKVVHACLESDQISESEELRILRAVLE